MQSVTYPSFHTGMNIPSVISPPQLRVGNSEVDDESFFLPYIILWNPYELFPDIFPPGKIVCPSCGCGTKLSYWNDGSSKHTQPRLLHDVDNIVLLVSAVYVCDHRHQVLAHDETILKMLPSRSMIPFVLLSRTGFTTNMINLCIRLTVLGLNFYKIETLLLERRWESFSLKLETLNHHQAIKGEDITVGDFWSSSFCVFPSNDIISKCFLATFLLNDQLYLREITSIPTSAAVSFDHTFKVAANIGYLRTDGKWVPQYDSLFVVLNEVGQIITWQLVKGTCFSEIEKLLENIKDRSQAIQVVYIDDCCKLRRKIHSVFGEDVSVKLDLFHATQRVTRTLRKLNDQFYNCVQDLRLVFRQDGDSARKRLCDTPDSSILMHHMDEFEKRWKDVRDSKGNTVFTSETTTAINNLKKHIQSGCLSKIPPGAGTNRNERFHHHTNSLFNRSKMGILLAYALLSVVIHAYNSVEKKHGQLVSKPIATAAFKPNEHSSVPINPIGITPKDRCLLSNHEQSDHWELDISENIIDLHLVVEVYTRCLEKLQIMKSLLSMGLPNLKECTMHFTSFDPKPTLCTPDTQVLTAHQKLYKYGLQPATVCGDGNCFFTAVASSMIRNTRVWHDSLSLAGVTVNSELTLNMVTTALRQVFVRELLGERRSKYEDFLVQEGLDYDSEANKFLTSSFYDSELGDTMPLALCTALQFSIIIFSTDARVPTMYVTPEIVASEATAFLVHTPQDDEKLTKGHYDYAVPFHNISGCSVSELQFNSSSCRCGVNKKDKSILSCKPTPFRATRCKCFKQSRSCTSLCNCSNCANPCGAKPLETSNVISRRKRKHPLQLDISAARDLLRNEMSSSLELYGLTLNLLF